MKKLISILIFGCIFCFSEMNAQNLSMYLKSGSTESIALTSINKITFSDTTININKTDCTTKKENISDVQKISFNNDIISGMDNPQSLGDGLTIYPNPSNCNSVIHFELKVSCTVTIEIVNLGGILLKSIILPNQVVGDINYTLNDRLSNGVYLCRVITNGFIKTTKLIVL